MTDKDLVKIIPSDRQLQYQQLEFYSFIHYTVNAFTDEEWGHGTEKPEIFNPTEFNAKQWVDAVKSAGLKGIILTCKHHDGFCLWNSKYTNHSIAASPFKNGAGDIVKELSDECKKQDVKFGVYLSPWDRNNKDYGNSDVYNDYFINQLTELLTNYGEIFSVWFDGACGEGPNGKKQVYDWERYYKTIRELQPNACIVVCGPDIRWCGNEGGHTRESEWSVVPKRLTQTEIIQEKSQQADDNEFREQIITSTDQDLGSRAILANETDLIYYPAEVNTSIRPGWFYHTSEDDKVKSFDELINVYYNSVGANAMFLLNLPPDKRGLIHENDCKRLKEIGDYLKETFETNLAIDATFKACCDDGVNTIDGVKTDDYDTYYKPYDDTTAVNIEIDFNDIKEVSHVVLKENIKLSQRIEKFKIYAVTDGEKVEVFNATIVGYKRIAKFDKVRTNKLIIEILDARVCPTLSFIGVY